ncbi:hypothetical protein ABW19_dt0201630 [Dactylella cylindrospora]|nr:hypothetical protein ABW19_dt0201630 [Dactylella cylindrospora]
MLLSNFPPDTDEKKEKLTSFFKNEAAIPLTTETATKVVTGLKEKYPTVEKWGIFGLCWGGKAATLIANSTKLFAASGQAHPAMLDPQNIADSPVPHLCLSSKDEDVTAAQKVIDIVSQRTDGSYSTIYAENIHGWMGARSNLKDAFEKESYEKGYKEVVDFFKKTL